MLPRNRAKLQAIKADTARSRETIEVLQQIIDTERQKKNSDEINIKLNEMEMGLGEWRVLLDSNDALIAKLEQPFLKFWKWI